MSSKDVVDAGSAGLPEGSGAVLPQRMDAQQFARARETLAGSTTLAALERLAVECSGDARRFSLVWKLDGSVDDEGACWLTLEVVTSVPRQCQRCLEDVNIDVRSVSRFRLVFAGEAWNDEDLEDDSFEALEVDGPLDVSALVEDEVLLCLPPIALHESCDVPGVPEGGNSGRPSPFAVLGKLKRN
ncbi:MAG TPA: YceD family protein [Methyloversatilis sp.]